MGTYLLVTPQPDELYHFGIKGMKWGIRRFQPYQKGERVKGGKEIGAATKVKQRPSSGNIIERYKAGKAKKKRVEALKKAQATRKANLDNEAAKKKAIESGSVEDLAKFKGQLTNEEYTRAFMRLQNEKKLSDMVAANQATAWDKIDKGMQIVQKIGGYANTIATAKENLNKLDDALHKKEKEDAKDKKEAVKKAFMNSASYEDLVKRANEFGLDTKDYNMVVARIKGEKDLREKYDQQVAANKTKEAEDAAFRKEQNAHAREQANNLKNGFYKIPPQTDSKLSNDDNSGSSNSTPEAESGKRVISGFRTADKPVSYNSAQTLSFGKSSVKKFSAKPATPSKVVTDTRQTVANTQAESARQKEVDKKRKAKLKR